MGGRMKYRKKPVIIDAFQWTGDPDQKEDPDWIVEAIHKGVVWFSPHEMCISTPEGIQVADIGYYIIRGVKGEIYPCRSDIFEMTYDKVEE